MSVSFDLTVDTLRERRTRMMLGSDDSERIRECLPPWLALCKSQIELAVARDTSISEVIIPYKSLADITPVRYRRSHWPFINATDIVAIITAVDANNSGFAVHPRYFHPTGCDCGQPETPGCNPCLIIGWSWT